MRTTHNPGTVTFNLPALDDATAVLIYNFLSDLVDRFDIHYGEQICRFYSQQNTLHTTIRPPPNHHNDPPA